LSTRSAIYRSFAQAIPSIHVIDKRGVAPCRNACPADQRAQGYIALIREGRFADAFRTIKEDDPFTAKHFTTRQTMAQVEGLFRMPEEKSVEVEVERVGS
jgi:NADPH-dependent glutamate synthase beta subunit-like oxidoreductase